MGNVTIKAHAEILDGWEVGSLHTVERTPYVDKMIASGYVTVEDETPDTEPETLGGSADADLTVVAAAVPNDDADTDTWRRFLTEQGIPYTVEQAEDAGKLRELWESTRR